MSNTPGSGVLGQLGRWLEKAKAWFTAKIWPWALANPKIAVAASALAGVGGLLYIGGNIITNGLIAGALISGGIGVIIWKLKASHSRLPRQLYNVLVSHPLGTDIALSAIAFMVSPGGITGWVAAAIAGLIASVWLAGAEVIAIEEPEPSVGEGRIIDVPLLRAETVRS